MITMLTDPRTEEVLRAADEVDHVFCRNCWAPGAPMMCGKLDAGDECLDECDHPTCPMCEMEWERHECKHVPLWRRWLSSKVSK